MKIDHQPVPFQGVAARGIIQAATSIVKKNGWNGFSMRKLSVCTGLSLPAIYKCFPGKKSLLSAMAKNGFLRLTQSMTILLTDQAAHPLQQLQQIWLAYWNFAMLEKELYQLMFSVGIVSNDSFIQCTPITDFLETTGKALAQLADMENADDANVKTKAYILWSMVHGFVSLNFIKRNNCLNVSEQLISDAINIITIV